MKFFVILIAISFAGCSKPAEQPETVPVITPRARTVPEVRRDKPRELKVMGPEGEAVSKKGGKYGYYGK
ncbi:hypothetical protein KKF34_03970 [Myxococcota bacterium]|nr:hypothetical protein [Myxococcota bacterium]MBU1382717.1 hypothetical protein [Myxococcota bacterium]MBU1496013.1 hypothetical protein [Myxococcota bacterium]